MRYGIAIIVIAFFFIIGSVVILSRGGSDQPTGETSRITRLAEYENNNAASVSWTMQGKVVGDDQYRAVRVTVTRNTRTAEVLNGYAQRVEKRVEFRNSPEGFAVFTRALDHLNFGQERTVAVADERGVCPRGNRYIYRVTDGTGEVMRTWSTTCDPDQGPFGGENPNIIRDLFQKQITDYSRFISGTRL